MTHANTAARTTTGSATAFAQSVLAMRKKIFAADGGEKSNAPDEARDGPLLGLNPDERGERDQAKTGY